MNFLTISALLFLVAGCVTHSDPPTLATASGSIEIRGEVVHPGHYPYRIGMKVTDLVSDAGGPTDFSSGITVVRSGTNLVNVYYGSPKSTLKSGYMKTPLQADDLVKIQPMY